MLRAGIRPETNSLLRLISAYFGFSFYVIFALTVTVDASDPPPALGLKIGLWEITSIDGAESMPVPAAILEKLTAEQRSRLQERLKSRSSEAGVALAQTQCLTSQQLRIGVPFPPYHLCTRKLLNSAGGFFSLSVYCQGQAVKREGTLQIEVIDSTTVRGEWRFHSTSKELMRDSTRSFLAVWKNSQCSPR